MPKKKVDREEGPAEAPTPSPGAAKPVLVAKWVVWLATAGALGIAGYFIGGSDVAQTQWTSGKNYVLKQAEIIKRDGLESWARGTVPEALKKPTREEMSKVQRMTTGTDKPMPEVKVTHPANTLTEAQERAIRAICKANGRTVPSNLQSMSKQDASALIDALKKGEEPAATEAPEEPF